VTGIKLLVEMVLQSESVQGGYDEWAAQEKSFFVYFR
jgi:hypothetical protein